jgi:macrolide transport system ATP-binding/permease protein
LCNGSKTAVWGENGTGKSTLLNLINSASCRVIFTVPKARIGYFHQDFANLDFDKTVLEDVMTDSVQKEAVVRTILARLLMSGDDVFKKVGVLSGGERIKVSFAKLFVSNANVLLLDEPTNYLDILSIKALGNVLVDYEGTVLFVSHDRAFVNKVADKVLILGNRKIIEYNGNIKSYEESNLLNRKSSNDDNVVKESMLRMRLTEIITKMSLPDCSKEALEKEYSDILEQLKCIKN